MQKNKRLSTLFASRLEGAELPVRAELWEKIQCDLPLRGRCRLNRKLCYLRIAAAVLILIVSIACLCNFTSDDGMENSLLQPDNLSVKNLIEHEHDITPSFLFDAEIEEILRLCSDIDASPSFIAPYEMTSTDEVDLSEVQFLLEEYFLH